RLRQYLEAQGYFAVYFEADKGDIEIDDTEHTDILLACTRHIIEDLKELADAQPLLGWLKDRLDSLVELGLTEVELEKVGVEFQLPQFVKLMTNFKSLPNLRADVRKKIDLYTPFLVEILNKFINQAKSKLPEQYFQGEIVVIVDNLDRMVLQTDGQHSNYERIFIDRRNLMQGLHCHLIYTIPISMKYAPYSPTLAEDYDQLVMLPMIMIRNRQGEPHQAGLEILKEMVRRRVERSQILITLENLFESPEALEILCQKSGGCVRNLVQLMQSAVKRSKSLPIADQDVNIAIYELQKLYHDAIYQEDWVVLANI
ncbi:MAG: ATP-binding protein, partial [Microcystaceae cyanobacterium]